MININSSEREVAIQVVIYLCECTPFDTGYHFLYLMIKLFKPCSESEDFAGWLWSEALLQGVGV